MNKENVQNVDDIELELEKQQVQEKIKSRGVKLNDYILVPVEYGEKLKEYLWFRVEDLSEGKVLGRLSNDPVYAHMKVGDVRWIKIEDISQIGVFGDE
jgi:hypothetical protein